MGTWQWRCSGQESERRVSVLSPAKLIMPNFPLREQQGRDTGILGRPLG